MEATTRIQKEAKLIDHLFRHQHGKMVSILTRIFGLSHLETIEDAVQDTFAQAILTWRNQIPDNPEAWLTKAAKNRAIDLLRKIKADHNRIDRLGGGPSAIAFDNLFLEHEIEDSQLRMIFTACHPSLNPKDQIAFALKTIAGFSTREIASALLLKEATIKKRLTRARQAIAERSISFTLPDKNRLPKRLERALEVIYLIFNEGFHSNRKDLLIRQDLCGEAIRLCKMILKKDRLRSGDVYALFALMCFHAARLESRTEERKEIIDLKRQDRSKWYGPLILLGHQAMEKAVETQEFSTYHYEAAIAAEHLKAKTFESTDWNKILKWSESLHEIQPTPLTATNMAFVLLQLGQSEEAFRVLKSVNPGKLEQREYLYYGTMAEYYARIGSPKDAVAYLDKAVALVNNESEKRFLMRKREFLIGSQKIK